MEKLLGGSCFRYDFAQNSPLLKFFSRFWTSAIEIEVVNAKEYSPELSVIVKASSNTSSTYPILLCSLVLDQEKSQYFAHSENSWKIDENSCSEKFPLC